MTDKLVEKSINAWYTVLQRPSQYSYLNQMLAVILDAPRCPLSATCIILSFGKAMEQEAQVEPYCKREYNLRICEEFREPKYKYNNAKRSNPAHPTFVNDAHGGLHLSLVTSKINWVHPLTMDNMPAKVQWRGTQCLSPYRVHKLISIHVHVTCELDLWPLTYKINRVHPLTMANMSAKFDKETQNGSVSIMFTSLLPYMFIVTLTFDLQNQ